MPIVYAFVIVIACIGLLLTLPVLAARRYGLTGFLVTVVAELALLYLGWAAYLAPSMRDEHNFYSKAKTKQPFLLSDFLDADRLCIRPGGIGSLHGLEYGPRDSPKYEVNFTRHYDSQNDWFILAFSEQSKAVKVIPIDYDQVGLANETEICAHRLRVDFNSNGQAAISAQPNQPNQ